MRVFSPYLLTLLLSLFTFHSVQAAQSYRLTVKTTPSNAKVTIWNIKKSFKQGMRLKPGRYDLQVHKAGYKAQRRWITIRHKNRTLRIKLKSKTGKSTSKSNKSGNKKKYPLKLKITPPDAKVQIMNIAPAFKQGILLAPGKYQLKISHPNYKTLNKNIKIKRKALHLKLKLLPIKNAVAPKLQSTESNDEGKSYALFISALPPGTDIIIFNIKPTFYQGIKLQPGRYDIQISSPSYQTRRRWIEIIDQDVYLDINLESLVKADAEALEIAYRQNQRQYQDIVTIKKSDKLNMTTKNVMTALEDKTKPDQIVHINITPADASLHLLNYSAKFEQGMLLPPGNYHLSVAKKGYPTRLQWFEVKDQALNLEIVLSQKQQCFYSKIQAGSAENRTEMTRLLQLQFYGNTVEGLYSTRMLPDGKAKRYRLFGKQLNDHLELISTIYYGKESAELHSQIRFRAKQAIMAFDGQQYILTTMKCPKSN